MYKEVLLKGAKRIFLAMLLFLLFLAAIFAGFIFFGSDSLKYGNGFSVSDRVGGHMSSDGYGYDSSAPSAPVNWGMTEGGMGVPVEADEQGGVAADLALSTGERKIIQNGELTLVVTKVEDAITALKIIAGQLGGRVDNVSYNNSEDERKKRASIILRVPSVNFDAGMEGVKQIAVTVVSERVRTDDVTETFIDLQARLKNLRAEEEQYQAIMKDAEEVADLLKVSQHLYRVRQNIEQLQGQLNYYSRQVDMSLITVYLSSDPDVNPLGAVWNPETTLKQAAKGLLAGLYYFLQFAIYFIVFLIPIFLLWATLIAFILWGLWKFIIYLKRRLVADSLSADAKSHGNATKTTASKKTGTVV